MVEVFVPLRDEPFFDSQTGRITIRWADYFDQLDVTVNENVINVEAAEAALSEVQHVQAFTAELLKAIAEVNQLTTQLNRANAQIAVLMKRIDNVEQLL